MTVSQLLGEYLDRIESEGRSIRSIRSQCKPLIRKLGHLEASKLTGGEIATYRMERRKERSRRGGPPSHSTINRELTYLRAALRMAYRDERLSRVPYIRMTSEAACRRMDWWTPEQVRRVVGVLQERGNAALADAVLAYHLTGWRKREILDLSWAEVRLQEGVIVLPPERSKSHEPRIFPVEGELREVLERRHRERDGSYVFHYHGRRRRDFRRAWFTARRDAGCQDLLLHGLRRTAARLHMLAGVPRPASMALLGWKSEATWRRYAMVLSEQDLRAAVRRFQEYAGG